MNDSTPKNPDSLNQDSLNPAVEQKLDQLLNQSFQPSESLSAEFDAKVMSSIRHETHKTHAGRGVLITMMLYWAIASLTAAWLLMGNPSFGTGESSGYFKLLLPLLGIIAAGLVFVVHQAKLRLGDLFLQTIQ